MPQKKIDLSAGIEEPKIDLSAGIEGEAPAAAPKKQGRPLLTVSTPNYTEPVADSLSHPFTTKGYSPLDAPLDFMAGIERGIGIDPAHPIQSTPGALANAVRGLMQLSGFYGPGRALEAVKGMVKAPIESGKETAQAHRRGDLPAFFQGLGQTTAAVEPFRAPIDLVRNPSKFTTEIKNTPGILREKARALGQSITGSSASKVTAPLAKQFVEDSAAVAEKQRAANLATGKTNQMAKGSHVLGERVKDLDAKLRTEAGEKYDIVRKSVADDPGVPMDQIGEAARHAEDNILKGSSESIKQFRELASTASEEKGIMSGGVLHTPGTSLYELLKEQGALKTGGNITFDDLQGYSSEIGTKLAKGGLQGDVYQALKYLKDKIDAAKRTIADRHGAGEQLKNADDFWRQYMDTFYDSDSAVAKVRESVGTLDPEYYADPFTKGKAGNVGIERLRGLPTRHAADATVISDLARSLRSASEAEPAAAVTGLSSLPSTPAKTYSPVAPEVKTAPQLQQPTPPTVRDIVNERQTRIVNRAAELMQFTKWDAFGAAGAALGALTGHGLASAIGEAVRWGVPYALSRPAIIEFLSKPTAADIAALEALPEPAKVRVQTQLRNVLNEERAAGRRIIPSSDVIRFIGPMGIPQNRRDAMDLLGQQQR